jgi:hypothetical protein
MADLINISTLTNTEITNSTHKVHKDSRLSPFYSNFTPASKEAIDLISLNHVGVSQNERLVCKKKFLVHGRSNRSKRNHAGMLQDYIV